jgi:acetate kinase
MADTILVINAGSSSIKFQLFALTGEGELTRQLKGQFDGIGTHPRLVARDATGRQLVEAGFPATGVADVAAAMTKVGAWLRAQLGELPVAVGHRVVHGGARYDAPVVVDEPLLTELDRFVPLAPLHQPANLMPIRALRAHFPHLPQVACFDTAFHRGHPELADRYAIPENLYAEGVRRYGFHGLSYEYIAARLPKDAPEIAGGRVVVAHLGSRCCGASGLRRLDVRAVRRPQRRQHDGFQCARWIADGHAAGPDRSHRDPLPADGEGHDAWWR